MREGLNSHYLRYLTFITWNLQVARKDRFKHPSDVWPIPILDEVKNEKPEETEDQKRQNYENFQRMVNLYK